MRNLSAFPRLYSFLPLLALTTVPVNPNPWPPPNAMALCFIALASLSLLPVSPSLLKHRVGLFWVIYLPRIVFCFWSIFQIIASGCLVSIT